MADKNEAVVEKAKTKKRFNALWIIVGSIVLVVVVMLIYTAVK
jgi:heme/copper-type cytochrome/quinol oxidase subunit 2